MTWMGKTPRQGIRSRQFWDPTVGKSPDGPVMDLLQECVGERAKGGPDPKLMRDKNGTEARSIKAISIVRNDGIRLFDGQKLP